MTFALLLLLSFSRLDAAPAPAEAELVDHAAPAAESSAEPEGWDQEVAPGLDGPGAQAALDAYLKKRPGGEPAAKAWLEKGRRMENLEEAMLAFKSAMRLGGEGSRSAGAAGMELGKLEYAMGRHEAALMVMDGIDADTLEPAVAAELLYWRAQARFVLKGVQRAQDDFEAFLKANPSHPLADAAALAVADCDAALKNEEAALTGYEKLWADPPSPVAPQALLQAAGLHLRAARPEKARPLLERLAKAYPESFEAGRAREQLAGLPAPAAVLPSPVPTRAPTGWTIQVGAYARRTGALSLFAKLKKRGYAVRLEKRVLESNVLHLIQVGRYKSKAEAAKAALRLAKREKVPQRVVEIR